MRLDKLVYAFILSNYTTQTVVKWQSYLFVQVRNRKALVDGLATGAFLPAQEI
jgi:hypothetical protein